jgi:hypothetical protein
MSEAPNSPAKLQHTSIVLLYAMSEDGRMCCGAR